MDSREREFRNRELMPGLSDIHCAPGFEYVWRDELEHQAESLLYNHFNSGTKFGIKDRVNEWASEYSEDFNYNNHYIPGNNTRTKKSYKSKSDISWFAPLTGIIGIIGSIFSDEDCLSDVTKYLIEVIEYYVLQSTTTKPTAPSSTCIVIGLILAVVAILVLGLLAVYAGPVLTSMGGLFATLAQFLEWIWSSFESIFTTTIDYVTFGFQYILDGWNLLLRVITYLRDFITDLTGANRNLVLLNLLTAFTWLISQLLLELFEVELEWEQTDFYNIFEFLDYPLKAILSFVEDFSGGSKNVLYYLVKVFLIPFEIGTLSISMIVGVVWYLVKELIDIIKNS